MPVREQAQALPVEPQQLDQMPPFAAKCEQRAGMRVLRQNLLNRHRQPVEALAHVAHAARKGRPSGQRHGVHRGTDITRASAPASTAASMLIRVRPSALA